MAKQIDWVSFNFSGNENGDSGVTLTASISESTDASMRKSVTISCDLPTADQAYDAWRVVQINALKTLENIS